MKNTLIAVILGLAVMFTASVAKADLLYGNSPTSVYRFYTEFQNSNPAQGWTWQETWTIDPAPMLGGNLSTGQELQFFCTKLNVLVSDAFKDPQVGQEYSAASLTESALSNVQKSALQSLFNHTYSVLLDAQELYASATGLAQRQAQNAVELLSMSLQFTVWEIMHESSGSDWDITTGNFMVRDDPFRYYSGNDKPSADQLYTDIVDLTSSWFDSLNTGIWTGVYANEHFYELTHFTAAGAASQPLIAVTGEQTPVVPEPGTMVILGLGLAGLGFARTRRKESKV